MEDEVIDRWIEKSRLDKVFPQKEPSPFSRGGDVPSPGSTLLWARMGRPVPAGNA